VSTSALDLGIEACPEPPSIDDYIADPSSYHPPDRYSEAETTYLLALTRGERGDFSPSKTTVYAQQHTWTNRSLV